MQAQSPSAHCCAWTRAAQPSAAKCLFFSPGEVHRPRSARGWGSHLATWIPNGAPVSMAIVSMRPASSPRSNSTYHCSCQVELRKRPLAAAASCPSDAIHGSLRHREETSEASPVHINSEAERKAESFGSHVQERGKVEDGTYGSSLVFDLVFWGGGVVASIAHQPVVEPITLDLVVSTMCPPISKSAVTSPHDVSTSAKKSNTLRLDQPDVDPRALPAPRRRSSRRSPILSP